MKNHRHYQRRNRYRNNNERQNNFHSSNRQVLDFANGFNYKRQGINKNNQNANKLVGKYTELAKEALSKGDKISSENYYQHADHFLRITNEKNIIQEVAQSAEKKNDEDKKNDTESANS